MLIVTAQNITKNAERSDGVADYDVWVGINNCCIWRGKIKDQHRRKDGAAALLRLIAARMELK